MVVEKCKPWEMNRRENSIYGEVYFSQKYLQMILTWNYTTSLCRNDSLWSGTVVTKERNTDTLLRHKRTLGKGTTSLAIFCLVYRMTFVRLWNTISFVDTLFQMIILTVLLLEPKNFQYLFDKFCLYSFTSWIIDSSQTDGHFVRFHSISNVCFAFCFSIYLN